MSVFKCSDFTRYTRNKHNAQQNAYILYTAATVKNVLIAFILQLALKVMTCRTMRITLGGDTSGVFGLSGLRSLCVKPCLESTYPSQYFGNVIVFETLFSEVVVVSSTVILI